MSMVDLYVGPTPDRERRGRSEPTTPELTPELLAEIEAQEARGRERREAGGRSQTNDIDAALLSRQLVRERAEARMKRTRSVEDEGAEEDEVKKETATPFQAAFNPARAARSWRALNGAPWSALGAGARLRELREDRKIDVKTFCLGSGISASQLSLIERGVTNVTSASWVRAARFIGLTPSSVLATDSLEELVELSSFAERAHTKKRDDEEDQEVEDDAAPPEAPSPFTLVEDPEAPPTMTAAAAREVASGSAPRSALAALSDIAGARPSPADLAGLAAWESGAHPRRAAEVIDAEAFVEPSLTPARRVALLLIAERGLGPLATRARAVLDSGRPLIRREAAESLEVEVARVLARAGVTP